MTKRELELIAEIDYCYWQIKNAEKELSIKQDHINNIIDNSTGYDVEIGIRIKRRVIYHMIIIIRRKMELGHDIQIDYEILQSVKRIGITA